MALQKQYKGLSGQLGRYEGGSLSLELHQAVVPIIDISQFAEPVTYKTSTQVFSAIGQDAIFVVPDDENWILWSIGVRSTGLPATDDFVVVPSAQLSKSALQVTSLLPEITRLGMTDVNDIMTVGWQSANGLWMYQGGKAGCTIVARRGTSTATITFSIGVQILKV